MRVRHVLSTVVILAALSCGSRVSPTAPDRVETGFLIRPLTDALRVTESVTFTATIDGRSVQSEWSSSDPAVLCVDANRQAMGPLVGPATLTASFEGQAVTRSIRVVPDFRGVWRGTLRQVTCQRLSGLGPLAGCSPTSRYRIVLTIDNQTGAAASGMLDLYNEPTVGPVSGSVAADGHLVLEGTATNAEHLAEITILAWDSYLEASGRQMAGSWRADSRFASGFGMQHYLDDYELINVTRAGS